MRECMVEEPLGCRIRDCVIKKREDTIELISNNDTFAQCLILYSIALLRERSRVDEHISNRVTDILQQ